jgi:hypothetical protein
MVGLLQRRLFRSSRALILVSLAHQKGRSHARPAFFFGLLSALAAQLGSKGLLLRHDCCLTATVLEHLTVAAASSCLRRFLATPLHEIIPS